MGREEVKGRVKAESHDAAIRIRSAASLGVKVTK